MRHNPVSHNRPQARKSNVLSGLPGMLSFQNSGYRKPTEPVGIGGTPGTHPCRMRYGARGLAGADRPRVTYLPRVSFRSAASLRKCCAARPGAEAPTPLFRFGSHTPASLLYFISAHEDFGGNEAA